MRLDNDDALYILNGKLEFYLKNIRGSLPKGTLACDLILRDKRWSFN